MNTRDVILVAGPSAAGKTVILNILRDIAQQRNVQIEFTPLSDSHTIFQRMMEDDARGGNYHYHEWCRQSKGHEHYSEQDQPRVPFTLAGSAIADGMVFDFFHNLTMLPKDGKIRFAEWSGGLNTNDLNDPASKTDLSFRRHTVRLSKRDIPSEGLNRVKGIIHPVTSDSQRMDLNRQRFIHLPTNEEQILGTRSWPLGDSAMRIFGRDDFHEFEGVARQYNIPIHHIQNDGFESFEGELNRLATDLFGPWVNVEGQISLGRKKNEFSNE